jgi:hypothetical protein
LPPKLFSAAVKVFLELLADWIFTLGILENGQFGAEAGRRGAASGPLLLFLNLRHEPAIIAACNR